MSATKLAMYSGIPRPTVARKLRTLRAAGVIERAGRTYVLVDKYLNDPTVLASLDATVQKIVASAE